jgi:type 1 fimbria pilin
MHVRIGTGLMMLFAAAALSAAAPPAKTMTLTGKVGDAMCGVTHMVKGDDAACTRTCVKGGAEYALIVKDKVYTLKADAKLKSRLDTFADQNVTVTGTQKGSTIDVASVKPAK